MKKKAFGAALASMIVLATLVGCSSCVQAEPPATTMAKTETAVDESLSMSGIWMGLGAVAVGGAISAVIIYFKEKKDEE